MTQWPAWVRVNQALPGGGADRRAGRAELLPCAAAYTRENLGLPGPAPRAPALVIVTGHQPSWHHSGIWIKTLAGAKMAEALRGTMVHVVLDHDECDTALAVPQRQSDGTWFGHRVPIESGPAGGSLELRRPGAGDLERFLEEVTQLDPEQLCNVPWCGQDVVDALRSPRLASLADVITSLQARLYTLFCVPPVLYLPVSQLSATDTFLGFVASILSNALYFAQAYNNALAEVDHHPGGGGKLGIRALAADSARGQTELPFWLIRPDGDRTSLHVRHQGGRTIVLLATSADVGRLQASSPEDEAQQLRHLLEHGHWRLRPKAIPLTLFLRLYLADWFIHGVGGARYEPIADHLIREYYGVRPPHYGVATCTALLPRCAGQSPAEDAGRLRHRLHHLRHNPEQWLEAAARREGRVNQLIDAKQEQIARAQDPKLSRAGHKAAWNRLALINQQICRHVEREIVSLQQAEARALARRASREVCQSREYFFGLFPEWRLRRLAEEVDFCEPAPSEKKARNSNFEIRKFGFSSADGPVREDLAHGQ